MADNKILKKETEIQDTIVLKQSIISAGLSVLGKTYSNNPSTDGSAYAFTKLTAEDKNIDIIGTDLHNYINLRDISLSKNHLNSFAESNYFIS